MKYRQTWVGIEFWVVAKCKVNDSEDGGGGWSLPYFERSVVEDLVRFDTNMKWDGDNIIIDHTHNEGEVETVKPINIDGVPHWGAGHGMTWQEIVNADGSFNESWVESEEVLQ